ncbi:UNVERIFIED_CONTAM: hypothetical protein NCL1_52537 [Trichonephila clavipes]
MQFLVKGSLSHWFSKTTKTRLFICHKKTELRFEPSDISDDDNTANKTYESPVANSWFLCKQDAISNKIPSNIKVDRLKFKFSDS